MAQFLLFTYTTVIVYPSKSIRPGIAATVVHLLLLHFQPPCCCLLTDRAVCPQDACSFNGAWRGKPAQMVRVYYVSSYFWDRASESGIIADKAAIDWKTSPGVSCVA
jgi:hypothetical protein